MAAALMKYETIDKYQIEDLMARKPVRDPQGWDDKPPRGDIKVDEIKADEIKSKCPCDMYVCPFGVWSAVWKASTACGQVFGKK